MTEPLSVVRYRSGKGCADGGALRKDSRHSLPPPRFDGCSEEDPEPL